MIEFRPLVWPSSDPRTPTYERKKWAYKDRSWSECKNELEAEVGGFRRWNGRNITVKCDYANARGSLTGRPRRDDDPGVCVCFTVDNEPFEIACDAYITPEANLWEIITYLNDLRMSRKRKVAGGWEKIKRAFKALPPASRDWWEVLGIKRDAPPALIKAARRAMLAESHPDNGHGDAERFKEIQEAFGRACHERGLEP